MEKAALDQKLVVLIDDEGLTIEERYKKAQQAASDMIAKGCFLVVTECGPYPKVIGRKGL